MTTIIQEQKIQDVIKVLDTEVDRDEAAKRLGYSSFYSMNTVMNRKGYRWDKEEQNFVKKPQFKAATVEHTVPRGKAGEVVLQFEKEKDAKKIAKELGFNTHRDMVNFLTEKGYRWDSKKENYAKTEGVVEEVSILGTVNEIGECTSTPVVRHETTHNGMQDEMMKKMDEILRLFNEKRNQELPNYYVRGNTYSKSLQMTDVLNRMIMTFSKERNLTQREITEIAFVEFFKKYGYEQEVKALIG